jgi:hypothetical protein
MTSNRSPAGERFSRVMIFFWLPSRQAAVPVACEPSFHVHFAREVFDPESRPQWHHSEIQLSVTDC